MTSRDPKVLLVLGSTVGDPNGSLTSCSFFETVGTFKLQKAEDFDSWPVAVDVSALGSAECITKRVEVHNC